MKDAKKDLVKDLVNVHLRITNRAHRVAMEAMPGAFVEPGDKDGHIIHLAAWKRRRGTVPDLNVEFARSLSHATIVGMLRKLANIIERQPKIMRLQDQMILDLVNGKLPVFSNPEEVYEDDAVVIGNLAL